MFYIVVFTLDAEAQVLDLYDQHAIFVRDFRWREHNINCNFGAIVA